MQSQAVNKTTYRSPQLSLVQLGQPARQDFNDLGGCLEQRDACCIHGVLSCN